MCCSVASYDHQQLANSFEKSEIYYRTFLVSQWTYFNKIFKKFLASTLSIRILINHSIESWLVEKWITLNCWIHDVFDFFATFRADYKMIWCFDFKLYKLHCQILLQVFFKGCFIQLRLHNIILWFEKHFASSEFFWKSKVRQHAFEMYLGLFLHVNLTLNMNKTVVRVLHR